MPERRRSLRVVHTSDVHLGAYAGGPKGVSDERNRYLEAGFRAVIDLAIAEAADLLIVAGDFFDSPRVPHETLTFAAAELDRFTGHAIVLPGNHDPIGSAGPYHRLDPEEAASQTRLVRDPAGDRIVIDELDLVLWGRAHSWDDHTMRPLEGLPKREDERWHIALGHGHFVEEGVDPERSLRISPEEVTAAAEWDYVALGHWEVHHDVSRGGATAVYSGAPHPVGGRDDAVAVVIELSSTRVRWRTRAVPPGGAPK